MLEEEEEKKMG